MQDYNSSDSVKNRTNLDKWHKFSRVDDTARSAQGWLSRRTTSQTGVTADSVLGSTGVLTVTAVGVNVQSILTATTAGALIGVPIGSLFTFTNPNGTFSGTVFSNTGTIITFAEYGQAPFNGNIIQAGGANAATFASLTRYTSLSATSTVAVCRPTMEWVTIKAHGIPIYNHFPAKFYNAYLPYNYGGPNVRTPEDCGALMITFCLYPGTYQPSGHINVSRAREFYIDFATTSAVDNTNLGTLIVIASAINFLLADFVHTDEIYDKVYIKVYASIIYLLLLSNISYMINYAKSPNCGELSLGY